MSPQKQAVEIKCPQCATGFRLWIPMEQIARWEEGESISCIKCGARLIVKKGKEGFEAALLKEEVEAKPQVPEPKAPSPAVPEAPAPEPEAAGEDTILLVEDDKVAREMAHETLKESGYHVVSVKNGPQAIEIIKSGNVKLIVTDLYLKNPNDPESSIDGEEFLQKIAEQGINLPSIVTTGRDMIDDIVLDPKWFNLHVKGFIQKGNPFWVDDLKAKIKEVLFKY